MSKEVKQAMKIFNENYPMLTITKVARYDSKRLFVFFFVNPNKKNYNGSWYGVDISTGVVSAYSPIAELDKFTKIVEENTLYKR